MVNDENLMVPLTVGQVFSESNVIFCNVDDACQQVVLWHRTGARGLINFVNPHSLMLAQKDREFSDILVNSLGNFADGAGLLWGCKILGLPGRSRCPGPDFMDRLLSSGVIPSTDQMFIGGTVWDGASSARRIAERFGCSGEFSEFLPGSFPFSSEELDQMVMRLEESKPTIVWVGLGTRKQEVTSQLLMLRYPDAIYLNVGAAFDFLSMRIRRAPPWLRDAGLEWAYRLVLEPHRLIHRNLDSPRYLLLAMRRRLSVMLRREP
jgi:N-acetylglucosaminyldiphosphoundecaprenol N-acetyl-beta-D-mannosaminyltransferase